MDKLAVRAGRGDGDKPDQDNAAATSGPAAPTEVRVLARARLLMVLSGLTTLIAIAAVLGAIGYRVFRAGGSGAATPLDAVVMLPKGARVIASSIADGHITVTLDIAGSVEIRRFDARTLKETGRIRFATEP